MSPINILFIGVAVLLPLIPAYLLYRLLPSKANVEGPWQGLQIKLTGAFGGYFVLVITILGFSYTLPSYDVWTVEGQVELSDRNGPLDESTLRFIVRPPALRLTPDGRFQLTVVRAPGPSGNPRFPVLIVEHPTSPHVADNGRHPGYREAVIYLEEDGEHSALRRHVRVSDPVVLEPRVP